MLQRRRRTGLNVARARLGSVVARACAVLPSAALPACGIQLIEGDDAGFVGSGGGGLLLDGGKATDASKPEDAHGGEQDAGAEVSFPGPEAGGSDAGSGASSDAGAGDAGIADDVLSREDAADAGPDAIDRTGGVLVDAGIEFETVGDPYKCPGISVFSINPALLGPGQAATLDVATQGAPATVRWSASPAGGGTFSSATSLTPTFICAGAGGVTITVTVGLPDGGPCAGVRYTSMSGSIDCRQ